MHGRKALGVDGAAQADLDLGADTGFVCGGGRGRIDDLRQNPFAVAGIAQALDDQVGVAGGARGGGVCRVGENYRAGDAAGLGNGALQRDQLALHAVTQRPEFARQSQRLLLRHPSITGGGHHHLAAELGHVGKRVTDHDAGGHGHAFEFEPPGFADQLAVAARLGDQLITPHQRRDHHPRDGGPDLLRDKLVQHARRALAGGGKVHMGVGVVNRHAVDLLEHAVGQDAVQVKRNHDRDVRAEQLAGLGQQIAFRVELALGRHGAMH